MTVSRGSYVAMTGLNAKERVYLSKFEVYGGRTAEQSQEREDRSENFVRR